MNLKACHCCGLIQTLPPLGEREVALCSRCGVRVHDPQRTTGRNDLAAGAAVAALILYPLAISLPVMRLEQFGYASEASIWAGSIGLLSHGELFVGGIVLLCSVVLPLAKILGLLSLSLAPRRLGRRHRAWVWRAIEWTGRWGMLDVLLVAVLVAWLKFGDLAEVTAGPGVIAFTSCVLANLLASAWFDPHSLWEDVPPEAWTPEVGA